ncbi:hypothetical protein KEM56_006698, partial [Ascosphaera pollenicola]
QEYDAAHNDMVDEDTHRYGLSDANHYPHHTYHSNHQQHPHQKPPDQHSEGQHSSPIAQPGPHPGSGQGLAGSRYEGSALHSPQVHHPHSQQQHLHLPLPHTTHPAAGGTHSSEHFGGTHGLRTTNGPSHGPFFEHFDPVLDSDPFGLTGNMHFQAPFGYHHPQQHQQSQQQQAASAAHGHAHHNSVVQQSRQ